MLTDGLEWCGLLVDYCDVFIGCLDSHSDGTHSLQRIHWWESDGMLHFSKSDEENKLVCISDGLRVSKCSSIFPFLDELFLEWLNRGFRHENHTHRCKQHRGGDHCYMIWTELLINRGVVKGHLITAALVSRRVHKHTHTHI